MKNTSIETLFNHGLREAENQVPEGTWKEIEDQLDIVLPIKNAPETIQKGKIGTAGKVIVGTAMIIGVIVTSFLLFQNEKTAPAIDQAQNIIQTEIHLQEQPALHSPADSKMKVETIIEEPFVVKQEVNESNRMISHELFTSRDDINPLPDQTTETETITKPLQEVVAAEPVQTKIAEPEPVVAERAFQNVTGEAVISPTEEMENPAESMLKPELHFNEVVTPNADNINDIFRIETNEAVESFTVTVMNLSGNIIHQWHAPNGFWDGRLENGSLAPAGKYLIDIFVQPVNGAPYHIPATVQLIR